jgi:uncharacterized damage-inducible protein DinB
MTDWNRLFAYDDWANRETLVSILSAAAALEKSRKVLGHIVGAERLWLSRIEAASKPPPPAVWPDLSLDACATAIDEMRDRWRAYLGALSPAEEARVAQYTNSKGEPWSSRVEDILMHVVMHSGYHRGQIAANMRAAGYEPAYTDYIHAVRIGKIG